MVFYSLLVFLHWLCYPSRNMPGDASGHTNNPIKALLKHTKRANLRVNSCSYRIRTHQRYGGKDMRTLWSWWSCPGLDSNKQSRVFMSLTPYFMQCDTECPNRCLSLPVKVKGQCLDTPWAVSLINLVPSLPPPLTESSGWGQGLTFGLGLLCLFFWNKEKNNNTKVFAAFRKNSHAW